MPYYLTPVAELPYPQTMSAGTRQDAKQAHCPLATKRLERRLGAHLGQDDYRALFHDPAIASDRQTCDVHAGDWTVALDAVAAFLQPLPAATLPDRIYHGRKQDPRIANLVTADRIMTLALLNTYDPIKYWRNFHGQLESNGQHRICWARTAGVTAVPVWFDAGTVRPPREAVLLQRG